MDAMAIVLEKPESLSVSRLELAAATPTDVVVEIEWSGISTGTEKLLWTGRMPDFPGMGYPLVPGYESVGRVIEAGSESGRSVGERVFVPGANCYGEVRGLFGGAAERLVVEGAKVVPIGDDLAAEGVLLALAATGYHAMVDGAAFTPPDLIVGHGVLGRLIARMTVAEGAPAPTVWEVNPQRMEGAEGYRVVHPDEDDTKVYQRICDVSGDSGILDALIARQKPKFVPGPAGEIVLAGFYAEPLSFSFAPAFIRESRIRIAAEWARPDLEAVQRLLSTGRLSLGGLITHTQDPREADRAYRTAFGDPACLKMILDWRSTQ
ncbi:chlorophyll synthesis pathway protein BchC [Rhodothalassium salexigens]|uniref:chlorophyll synthesis pathway protein BchC n=1 Tax=Rhodothalassium salexigens TaxID=1086 RepID=UPI001914AEDF|nr:chlorophyll synthesis pathway protein BchC [Rhodothalassium salexigens]MBK5912389.1 chlorophyll synthesis pathway protein BchC [Rhodothalassium salexigens]MBK5919993.1 chlorophyll synthesis pathway protein BchC [Rhodothalassium salexigens]